MLKFVILFDLYFSSILNKVCLDKRIFGIISNRRAATWIVYKSLLTDIRLDSQSYVFFLVNMFFFHHGLSFVSKWAKFFLTVPGSVAIRCISCKLFKRSLHRYLVFCYRILVFVHWSHAVTLHILLHCCRFNVLVYFYVNRKCENEKRIKEQHMAVK